jgi:peptidoglycan DL-endopeptidase CwlO
VRVRPQRVRELGVASVVSTVSLALVAAFSVLAVPFANAAAPVPVTTCAALASGSSGAAVTTVQKVIGADPDGDFGPATKHSLQVWQKAQGIRATGVVDAATWAALPTLAATKACGQAVTGSGVTVTCAQLSAGAAGLAVVVLQTAVGAQVDGSYGAATLAAVKRAQVAAHLDATGVTTARTWKALGLLGTPACSTGVTANPISPPVPSDNKAQLKIRRHVVTLAAALVKHSGVTTNPVALRAMAFAKRQIGKPYVWGGTGPSGYDCSGLQQTSYIHAGLTIPRVSAAQYAGAGEQVPLNQAKQGDLLFYASDVTKPTSVYHVVMYIGNGQVLEAPHTGTDVAIQPLWTTDLLPQAVRPVGGLILPLHPGASGWTVTQLQQNLNRHGSALTVDGGYGPATEKAVKSWQTRHHLSATGVVTLPTWLTFR